LNLATSTSQDIFYIDLISCLIQNLLMMDQIWCALVNTNLNQIIKSFCRWSMRSSNFSVIYVTIRVVEAEAGRGSGGSG